jgi:hypothetical protein
VEAIRSEYPESEVQVWAFDEHRLGLQPIVRRMWIGPDEEPILPVDPRYDWLYLYGFVRPASGETWWLILPTVSIEVMALALEEFAQGVGVSSDRRIVLLLDRAGWHDTDKLRIPDGIHLVFLPAYSPELQPAERLWPLADECIASGPPASIDDLEDKLAERCRALRDSREVIKNLTNYHWWPAEAA